MSSANPSRDRGKLGQFKVLSKGALQNKKRIGDNSKPCSTPAFSWRSAVSTPSTSSVVDLSVRNKYTSCTNQSSTPFLHRLSSSRRWLTISNTLAMSKDKTNAIWFLVFYTIYICLTSSSITIFVDLFLQLPIWLFRSKPTCSAKALSLREASVSITLLTILSKAIGLYAPRSTQSGLLGLQRTIVQAAYRLLGQQLALVTIVIKTCNALINSLFIAQKKQLGILSAPRHLSSLTLYTISLISSLVTS